MAVIAIALSTLLFASPVAEARPNYTIKYNCGIATCSVYLSRDVTKLLRQKLDPIKNNGPIVLAGAAGAACAALALPSGPGSIAAGAYCGGAASVYGSSFVNTLKTAASRNECVRLRTIRNTPTVVGMYNDHNGKFCK